MNKRACERLRVRPGRVRVRRGRTYGRALCVRVCASACAWACVRVCACVRVRLRGRMGERAQFKSESSPRLSSSFLGRCGSLCVPIQRVTRLDRPMVQGHRLDQSCGVVGAYTGVLTFDRQDHDRCSWRTRTARQRRQEEQDYRSNQDYDAGSLEHGAHSVRSFG